ncbi:unnamed protein product [Prorocentrum cordatum]|uniref:SET domain-containing protein n=1 Tax=Prorocentrum cordatum TaxID=2364126 RepID=A0ABN9T8E5_9DINO|nr:unnamed protein product [Polarella glacialis]
MLRRRDYCAAAELGGRVYVAGGCCFESADVEPEDIDSDAGGRVVRREPAPAELRLERAPPPPAEPRDCGDGAAAAAAGGAWDRLARALESAGGSADGGVLALRQRADGCRGLCLAVRGADRAVRTAEKLPPALARRTHRPSAARALRDGELLLRVPAAACWSVGAARGRLAPFAAAGGLMLEVAGVPRLEDDSRKRKRLVRIQRFEDDSIHDSRKIGDERAAHLALLPGSAGAASAARRRARGEAAEWPAEPDVPVRWPPSQIASLLKGTEAAEAVEVLRRRALREWRLLWRRVFSRLPGFFDPRAFCLELFLWAWAVVCSRAVEFPAGDAAAGPGGCGRHVLLVPVLDMLNHDASAPPRAPAGASADGRGERLFALAPGGCVEFRADREYQEKRKLEASSIREASNSGAPP